MNKSLREQLAPLAGGTRWACASKTKYQTKQEAETVMHKRMTAERDPAPQLYAYHCTHCDGWHLTKMEQHA